MSGERPANVPPDIKPLLSPGRTPRELVVRGRPQPMRWDDPSVVTVLVDMAAANLQPDGTTQPVQPRQIATRLGVKLPYVLNGLEKATVRLETDPEPPFELAYEIQAGYEIRLAQPPPAPVDEEGKEGGRISPSLEIDRDKKRFTVRLGDEETTRNDYIGSGREKVFLHLVDRHGQIVRVEDLARQERISITSSAERLIGTLVDRLHANLPTDVTVISRVPNPEAEYPDVTIPDTVTITELPSTKLGPKPTTPVAQEAREEPKPAPVFYVERSDEVLTITIVHNNTPKQIRFRTQLDRTVAEALLAHAGKNKHITSKQLQAIIPPATQNFNAKYVFIRKKFEEGFDDDAILKKFGDNRNRSIVVQGTVIEGAPPAEVLALLPKKIPTSRVREPNPIFTTRSQIDWSKQVVGLTDPIERLDDSNRVIIPLVGTLPDIETKPDVPDNETVFLFGQTSQTVSDERVAAVLKGFVGERPVSLPRADFNELVGKDEATVKEALSKMGYRLELRFGRGGWGVYDQQGNQVNIAVPPAETESTTLVSFQDDA